jgi:enamine deaminase RidA (YjgF/YER057c/UK114 family)
MATFPPASPCGQKALKSCFYPNEMDAESKREETMAAKITHHSPWTWQDKFQFTQAHAAEGGRTIYCAGQVSADGEGQLINPGDMGAQIEQAMDNVEAVLKEAGASLKDVVRLNFYVTDVPAFMANHSRMQERLRAADAKPPGTMLGVAGLFHPDALIEIEATAVI